MVGEKSFFFRDGDRPLYGTVYSPEAHPADAPKPSSFRRGVVVCDSLFEEKFWCERVLSNMGRCLAEKGFEVLVFDYSGYGNSVGQSTEVDVPTLERDIEDACDLMADSGIDRITLAGVRWGAALACRAAAARPDVDSVYLINPVKSWTAELSKALRSNVAGQYALFRKTAMTREDILAELATGGDCVRSEYKLNNVDGYVFSKSFLDHSHEMELPIEIPDRVRSVTVFTIPVYRTPAEQRENELAMEFRSVGVECDSVTVPDDNPFWLNSSIFTSIAPNLYNELSSRLKALDRNASTEVHSEDKSPNTVGTIENDGVRESAVSFTSSEGHLLYGVLYLPESHEMRDLGFVFSHGGLIGMNGAYRFHTRAARRFASEGYPCLCFDPHGMGRSQGTSGNEGKVAIFRSINLGRFADDVRDAVSYLQRATGRKKVVLFGVCGGAITSLIAQSRIESVGASVLASTPVMLPGHHGPTDRLTVGYARYYLGMYSRKILKPGAWWRFITFRSNYRVIYRISKVAAGGLLQKVKLGRKKCAVVANAENLAKSRRAPGIPTPDKDDVAENLSAAGKRTEVSSQDNLRFNELYLESYRKIIDRGDRILFFYGENDNFRWEFSNEFVENYPEDYNAGRGLITVEEIARANHMYTLREWQDQICDYCLNWVENVPVSEGAAPR
jgi:pimeloyl-ACP methyl ester carboxylesterase